MVSRTYNNVSTLKRDPCNTRTIRTRCVAVGKRKWLLFVDSVKQTWGQKCHYTLINYSGYTYLNFEERWFTHFSHSTQRSVSRNAMHLARCVFQRTVSIKFILLTWAMQKGLYFTFRIVTHRKYKYTTNVIHEWLDILESMVGLLFCGAWDAWTCMRPKRIFVSVLK